ncbi:MAG: hypothetical protein H0X29_02805, partial [Parachlamydiaceae bacterium]|nr:hypothetical protein [Parachlamydiaceae bacterium]
MIAFNNTSKVLPFADQITGRNGVVLPHSSHVLLKSDINDKIERTKKDIEYFSNAQSQKKSGGKRFRTRQNSLQSQVKAKTKRLALLTLAAPLTKVSLPEEYAIINAKLLELSLLVKDMERPKYLKNLLDDLFDNEIIFDLEMERIPSSDNLFKALSALNEINQASRYEEQYNNILALCADLKSLFDKQIEDLTG